MYKKLIIKKKPGLEIKKSSNYLLVFQHFPYCGQTGHDIHTKGFFYAQNILMTLVLQTSHVDVDLAVSQL